MGLRSSTSTVRRTIVDREFDYFENLVYMRQGLVRGLEALDLSL